jgi:hypothetical protein
MKSVVLKLNNEDLKKNIFWFSLSIIVISMIFYVYFVISTVKNVVARDNIEIKNSELALLIGSKEFDFINLKNNVTLSLAESKGFKEVSDKVYITSKSLGFAPKVKNEIQ